MRKTEGVKRASIDIGTNTVRLLIATVETDGNIVPHLIKRAVTRLGGGYTGKHGIAADAIERTVGVLLEFAAILSAEGVDKTAVCATSVMRRAVNADAVIEEVSSRTGLEIEVITGETEARLSMLGVTSALDKTGLGDLPLLTIDIGGGSTEFITSKGGEVKVVWSMELGVVHLTESSLLSDPPKEKELAVMDSTIDGIIGVLKAQMKADGIDPAEYSGLEKAVLIGTAGTITTLAAIDANMKVESYDPAVINNYRLTKSAVSGIFNRLKSLTLKERKKITSIEKGREDVIVAGTAITLSVMRAFGFDEIVVSDAGLLEGLLLG